MSEQRIENVIDELLTGDVKKNTLDFVAYLKENAMLFERAKGYWENQHYWLVKYNDEYVCFILINGIGVEEKFAPLTIWSDDSDSNWFENYPLDEYTKELIWANVDFCENCGGPCSPGKRKIVFGKEFNNVCRTTMRFINPDERTFECIKKMVDIRKNTIVKIV